MESVNEEPQRLESFFTCVPTMWADRHTLGDLEEIRAFPGSFLSSAKLQPGLQWPLCLSPEWSLMPTKILHPREKNHLLSNGVSSRRGWQEEV